MQTKFTPLVNLRKSALREGERKLIAINQKISDTQQSLDRAQQHLAEVSLPQKGESYREMMCFQSIKEGHLQEINRILEQIAAFKYERKAIEEELRLLNMEYEKASYLDSLEKKKIIDAKKRKETQELDEISVMLYNTRSIHEGGVL